MFNDNKHNLLYFEGNSMRDLYNSMEDWQNTNQKRLLSISIQYDNGQYCCIALTNPTEVILVDAMGMSLYTHSRALAVTLYA
jgi:hypothetical protein